MRAYAAWCMCVCLCVRVIAGACVSAGACVNACEKGERKENEW